MCTNDITADYNVYVYIYPAEDVRNEEGGHCNGMPIHYYII